MGVGNGRQGSYDKVFSHLDDRDRIMEGAPWMVSKHATVLEDFVEHK